LVDEAVPVSFHVSGKRRGLVFTGPNTGGKTVALKTAGLLSLMVQAGLHIPASSQSSFPVFRSLFADIGDDQSIASNLSTFSSHLAKMVAMENELELPSLLILDEVGAGTDPSEGGALGTALVEHFLARGALVIASTHHGLLKAYASTTEGIDAASFQFDPKTYAPTYTIVEGARGRSLAFEMAERLGLPSKIITRARELQSERERQVGELVERLEAESAELDAQRERIARDRRAATAARARIEAEEEEERLGRRERLTSFRRELEEELDSTRRELREVVAEARQASKEQSSRLNELEKTLSAKLESAAAPLISKVEAETAPLETTASKDAELKPGMRVLVASFGMEGEILRLVGNGQAEVNVRDKKLRIPVEKLEPLPRRRAPRPTTRSEYGLELKKTPSELNLIGCTVEDALDRADKFLDDAFLSEHREVRLIHGHGTGRLKSALREWLTGHPQVANQKSENRGGVTVVELKE
jgi:DNA mismatch repair protein MutS2